MAVAGNTAPALLVARIDGRYWIQHRENRPTSILANVEAAVTHLRSGVNVWIAASDREALEREMGVPIRSIQVHRGAA